MTSRRDKRKQAYQFIYDKLHDLDHRLDYNAAKSLDVTSIISLAEIDKLKNGYSDPSEELVLALKKLLHYVETGCRLQKHISLNI